MQVEKNQIIPFYRPYFTGLETKYVQESVQIGHIGGDGPFSERCHTFFEEEFGFEKCFLTTSCTDALEMAAILAEIGPGDEVILPSFTYVSTANAFILRGAKVVFADSKKDAPTIDPLAVEALITDRTKAIVAVHYCGFACDMDELMGIAQKYNLLVIEDAATCFNAFYKGRPLGGIGHLGALSFHETKNITCGEGGLLVLNDAKLIARAEIIREKGTNRSAFFRGEVSCYEWIDVGSSFLPSDLTAAFLWGQLIKYKEIQQKRKLLWESYKFLLRGLENTGNIQYPFSEEYSQHNYHAFFFFCKDPELRDPLIAYLSEKGMKATFHYLPLHSSPFHLKNNPLLPTPNTDRFAQSLIRLPFYCDLTLEEVERVVQAVNNFFE